MPFRRLIGIVLLSLSILGFLAPLIRPAAPSEALLSDRLWGLQGCLPAVLVPVVANWWAVLCDELPWLPPIACAVIGLALRPWRRTSRRADGRPYPDGIAGLTLIFLAAWCIASSVAFAHLLIGLLDGLPHGSRGATPEGEIVLSWFRAEPGWMSSLIAPLSVITGAFAIRQLASPIWSSLAIVIVALAAVAIDTAFSKAVGFAMGGLSGTEALVSLWPTILGFAGIAWYRSGGSIDHTGW
jgi:hypothetical protein